MARATSEEGRVCSLHQASREADVLPGFEVSETPRDASERGLFCCWVEMKRATSSVLFQHWNHSEGCVERCGCGMNSSKKKKRDSFRIYGLASVFGPPVKDFAKMSGFFCEMENIKANLKRRDIMLQCCFSDFFSGTNRMFVYTRLHNNTNEKNEFSVFIYQYT